MGDLVRLDPRRSPRRHVVHGAMEFQAALSDARRAGLRLWEAAAASGDWTLMAETRALAGTLDVARTQARRIAGRADELTGCADGNPPRMGCGRAS